MVYQLPITEVPTRLSEVIKRVQRENQYVVLEKDGVPVAGLMDIDEFEDYLELKDPKVREHIRKSHEEYLAGKSRPIEEFLAELRGEKRGKPRRRQRV